MDFTIIRKIVGKLALLCMATVPLFFSVAIAGPLGTAFVIDADSETLLSARFDTAFAVDQCANPSFGNACADIAVDVFPMPNGEFSPCEDCLFIIRRDVVTVVGSGNEGVPDNPIIGIPFVNCVTGTEQGCAGVYNNTDEGVAVNWRYYNLASNNEGYTGQLEYRVAVPAPGATALLVLGLMRLGCSRRRHSGQAVMAT